jgi:hypothetical protein
MVPDPIAPQIEYSGVHHLTSLRYAPPFTIVFQSLDAFGRPIAVG